jgi:hypothetical protein
MPHYMRNQNEIQDLVTKKVQNLLSGKLNARSVVWIVAV